MINTDKISDNRRSDNHGLLYGNLTYKIRGAVFNVYNTLGYGHKEQVYQHALVKEFTEKGIPFKREVNLSVNYKGTKVGNYKPDFIINNKVILEIKATEFLPKTFSEQLLHYLKSTGYNLGILINFGSTQLQIKRLIWTNPRKSVPNPRKSGFTLMEMLIVISIIGVAFTSMMAWFNPKRQIDKAFDNRRKTDLSKLKTFMEDWHNDKNCYPRPDQICYSNSANNNLCNICGKADGSPKLSANFRLPCDPGHPSKTYLYDVDNTTCPQTYRIYTKLQINGWRQDPEGKLMGCFVGGCGPAAIGYGYDFGISSGNAGLNKSTSFSCNNSGTCVYCGTTGEACEANSNCLDKNKIYGTIAICQTNR